jgi:hypothetical protein
VTQRHLYIMAAFLLFAVAGYVEWYGPACKHFWGLPMRLVPARCLEFKR